MVTTGFSFTLRRKGYLIEIQAMGVDLQIGSTFYPNDFDKTFNGILSKIAELGENLDLDTPGNLNEKANLRQQLTAIYEEYFNSKPTENSELVLQLTETILKKFTVRSMVDTGELFVYDAQLGVDIKGEPTIKAELERLHPTISNRIVNEVIGKLARRCQIPRSAYDSDPSIRNIRNGLLNLITRELKPHSPDYPSLIQIPVKYDPQAKCPRLLRFLAQVQDKEGISTLVRLFGYMLWGTSQYEKVTMFVGPGGNGKSVLIKVFEAFVGPQNASHVSLQELAEDRFAAADLYGKLLNSYADLGSRKIRATNNFKLLTSGDRIRAQHKHKPAFDFVNKAKLLYSANELPESEDTTPAFFRRWIILNFTGVFEGEKKDTDLISKLTTESELSGLLNLALVGLNKLREDNGFHNVPIEVIRKQYESYSSSVSAFLDEECVVKIDHPEFMTPTSTLYEAYFSYCKNKRIRPVADNKFGGALAKIGITHDYKMRNRVRKYYYFGVMLRSELAGHNQTLI